MKLNKLWKKGFSIKFIVEGRPPKKSDAKSCWASKEAEYVFKLREKALETCRKAGLDQCFTGPVKLELTVHASNILTRKDKHDYVSDLDTLIAGVLESIQPASDNPQLVVDPIFKTRDEIGPKVPLIIEDDSQLVTIIAKKVKSEKTYYEITIEEESG